ncbi:MAG: zinc carboxypeptidase, partial [Saprospiraceae bacterium]|nr:zinc carboxypeptidase [Saprospiraceae bacterium]
MKRTFTFLLFWVAVAAFAQKQPLTYYLPDITYDKNLPTPEAWLGYQVGEWHVSHDQLLGYMKTLAAASPRAKLVEHGRTFENRPLIHLIITSEKNHKSLDDLKAQHVALSNPSKSAGVDLAKVPAVLYQGYTIHGNEPSGSNAAMMVAYYLLAGKSKDLDRLLEDVIIIFDPCFNPDGMNRFASWVNTHRNKNLSSDPNDREFNEPWPRGRSNHYWFDLNRDWLPAQLPESQGRVRIFHEWKPNVLTDHHEMGSNTTFFFMPGVPSRVHPLTPKLNQELTERIGNFHAEALDGIGSLYFTKEGYDDYYYGKGSTYPDANGCVGILFEQASSRGHVQQTDNGDLTFAFTIRNQVAASLSTHKAVREMKKDLLSYQRDFYTSALDDARNDQRKAYIFGDPADKARTAAFIEILRKHQIEVHTLKKDVSAGGHQFTAQEAYLVPLDQPQYRLIHGIFETRTAFEDSIFYDISGWTYPLAFNLPYSILEKRAFDEDLMGDKIAGAGIVLETPAPEFSEYAYLMEWTEY